MALNHGACGIFNPVDIVGDEGITQPRHAEDTDTGAHPGFESTGAENTVRFHAAQHGGQGRDAQHNNQDRVGGIHQRRCHQTQAWAVDDGINHHADHPQQEQQHRQFCARFDLNFIFTAQFDQTFFQTFQVHRIARKFGVKQRGDQE
ncbi:hypothetical protein D3C80_1296420 [compost metagenome]